MYKQVDELGLQAPHLHTGPATSLKPGGIHNSSA